ncbi:MAG: transporter permease [Haloplasmataceae bacterium]|jgi:D-methionine transport system permease protein|nr:transporter permease [Haloplasmataceae bacterium]
MDKLNKLTEAFLPHVKWVKVLEYTYETLYMTAITTIFVFIFGLLLGLILFLTNENHILVKMINKILSTFINIFRSIPFIILIVLLIPFTNKIIGNITGKEAALPALIIAAIPFYARLVEIALREINKGVIEAARAMGASFFQIITKVLIPESLPALISGITVTAITLLSYTAMAGVIGAGGLGYLAIDEGFSRSRHDVTLVATIVSIMIVLVFQSVGDYTTKKIDKR